MRGLILKDFWIIKDTIKTTLAILVILLVYCLFRQQAIGLVIVPTLICAATSTSSLKLDYGMKWDKIALTMPINRKDIVRSKYIELLILCVFGLIMGIIFGIVANIVGYIEMNSNTIYIGIICGALGLVSGSVHLFLLYKFGGDNLENSEILLFVAYGIGIAVTVAILFVYRSILEMSFGNIGFLSLIYLSVAFCVLLISYKMSVLSYSKKELC